MKAHLLNTDGETVEYLPRNAKALAKLQIEEFNIGKDDFQKFYDDSNQLLEAFKDELKVKKGETKSEQYNNHLDYIWTAVDPKKLSCHDALWQTVY